MKDANILSLNGVKAAYGESTILWGASLAVKKGAITTVMGRNGVGKTTLLKTVMGLVKAREGRILLNGQDITNWPSHKITRAGIGYVPQGREIFPKLTVYENLKLGMEAAAANKPAFAEEEIYALFPILKEFRRRLGGNLSGGQQQQLAIARVLISGPSLLLLDEPTEGIQPSIAIEIGNILRQLAEEKGIAVLLVEQKIDFARQVTDYFYFMERGKMVKEGEAVSLDFRELQEHIAV
ncbi:urea ABC transporter ATP-binding subunit UrtE [uncultured Chitinophaga sp.]|jgi:urea ABC transporter, ATP-binding protein UrtE|uniref:urea ABC transporter ATP-binding subunit UrtE n=1 Tax=uncultured Chitinophaga sp. TaxID=339340 RepID=UPI002603268B|nr:urea ABC transporter ATP-binding subunit UrtE [uncultured Chitinophaga sp.]